MASQTRMISSTNSAPRPASREPSRRAASPRPRAGIPAANSSPEPGPGGAFAGTVSGFHAKGFRVPSNGLNVRTGGVTGACRSSRVRLAALSPNVARPLASRGRRARRRRGRCWRVSNFDMQWLPRFRGQCGHARSGESEAGRPLHNRTASRVWRVSGNSWETRAWERRWIPASIPTAARLKTRLVPP